MTRERAGRTGVSGVGGSWTPSCRCFSAPMQHGVPAHTHPGGLRGDLGASDSEEALELFGDRAPSRPEPGHGQGVSQGSVASQRAASAGGRRQIPSNGSRATSGSGCARTRTYGAARSYDEVAYPAPGSATLSD